MTETLGHLTRAHENTAHDATSSVSAKPKRRREVKHIGWLRDMTAANEMGVYWKALCGRWVSPWDEAGAPPNIVRARLVEGIPVIEIETTDCQNCVRAYARHLRRRLR
ncbi:hypothetical protein GCM10027596_35880 [Nocardioides korecus]